MTYEVTIDENLQEKLDSLKSVNFKEYTAVQLKVNEMKEHAKVLLNHRTRFNTFDKPLQDYKWVEINDNVLVFTIDANKRKMHLCEYLKKDEVFNG